MKRIYLVSLVVFLIFPSFFCSTTLNYKNVDEEIVHTENVVLANEGLEENGRHTDLKALMSLMTSIDNQLGRFNTLYLGRLDEKLTSLASHVASLDSNVRNIQERAHVWDTFQLHVAAWNEQIKSLDRKVNIISSGQEKLINLDGKLTSIPSIEFTSQRILTEVLGLHVRFETLGKSQTVTDEKALYGEFATRGVLAALKSVEGKVDSGRVEIRKLFTYKRQNIEQIQRNKFGNETVVSQNKKLVVKCTTPPVLEELVKDMSSKVDLIYDKVVSDNSSDEDEQPREEVSEELEKDYSVEMYQSDDANIKSHEKNLKLTKSEAKAIKKLRRQFKRSSKERFDKMLDDNCAKTTKALNHMSNKITKCNESSENKVFNLIQELINTSNNIYRNIETVKIILNGDPNFKTEKDNLACYNNQVNNIRSDFRQVFAIFFQENKCDNKNSRTDVDNLNEVVNKTSRGETSTNVYVETSTDNVQLTSESDFEDLTTLVSTTVLVSTQSTISSTESTTSLSDMDIDISETKITEKCLSRWNVYEDSRAVFKDVQDLTCYILFSGLNPSYEFNLCKRRRSELYCSPEGFITIQSRRDGSVNFTRNWNDYTFGFGDLSSGNFWIGNEAIHVLTKRYNMTTLNVNLEDFDHNQVWAQFGTFEVSSRKTGYALKVSDYSGNASDSLSYHSGSRFSTFDQTNDRAPSCCPCSQYGGGWWFDSCFESNLNGNYYETPSSELYRGIIWEHWREENSLAATKMAIKYLPKGDTNEPEVEDP